MSRSLWAFAAMMMFGFGAGTVRAGVMDITAEGDVERLGNYRDFEVGGEVVKVEAAESPREVERVQLVLMTTELVDRPELVVGSDTASQMRRLAGERPDLVILEPRSDARFLEAMVAGPSVWDQLGSVFEVEAEERPWSTTTTVHVLAGRTGVVPYAAVAHEMDVWEDQQRVGVGAGAMVIFDKHSSFGAEVIRFNSDLGESASKDTRFMARWQVEF